MSNAADLSAAAAVEESHVLYRRMVDLEIRSTFGFQGSRWLGDVAPRLLSAEQLAGVGESKRRAAVRSAAETQLHKSMLFVKGWPTRMLTDPEAALLARVRQTVSTAIDIPAGFLEAAAIHDRYAELITQHDARGSND